MKNFRRNLKAISPIFATLILIAIAVIAGVVVYMFTSGTLSTMTSGGTAGQEKVAVQAISQAATSSTTGAVGDVTFYAQSVSGGTITISNILVKDGAGNVVGSPIGAGTSIVYVAPASATGIKSELTTVKVTLGTTNVLNVGESYTLTLVTAGGANLPTQSFKAVD